MSWVFVKDLGKGAFGQVSLWTNVETNQSVAIKKCLVDLNSIGLDQKDKLKKRWAQEYKWMNEINTTHIVRACLDQCLDLAAQLNDPIGLPVIIMEYCDGGNLRTKLQQIENVNGLREHDVRQVLSALGNAILYLHEHHEITHRDIKPDNIVIKYAPDGKPIYKLTDMGYARLLDTNTIIGSMVGSQNYLAPEIILSAEYKNSVDYWSMGIVAFEIISGTFPFLPDQSLFITLKLIEQKPSGCIAVTKSNDGAIHYHTHLFPEIRLSAEFRKLIEPWLRLALERDGRKRGYVASDAVQQPNPPLKFYKKLDLALSTKILTVYWLNQCKYLSYCVDQSTTMASLYRAMQCDTSVEEYNCYFVLPNGHTLECLRPDMKALEFYDEQFLAEDRPMLYLVDIMTGGLCNPENPFISELLIQIFNTTIKGSLQPRILKQCFFNALYVHQNELRRMRDFVFGINDFGMNLEEQIMREEQHVQEFHEKILHYNGQVTQYEIMVAKGKRLLEQKQIFIGESIDNELEGIAQNFRNNFSEYLGIHSRLKAILNNIRLLISESPLATYLENVKVHVQQFEKIFEEVRDNGRSITVEDIRTYMSNLLRVRLEFFENSKKWLCKKESSSSSMIEILLEFSTIRRIIYDTNIWNVPLKKMEDKTAEFMQKFGEKFNSHQMETIIEEMDTLNLDSDDSPTSLSRMLDLCLSGLSTEYLINDMKTTKDALSSLLDK